VWVICSVSVLLGRFARLERIVCSKVPFFPDKISVCQAEVLRLSMCDVQALTSNLFFKKKKSREANDVSLHSAYIYYFSMYTFREREAVAMCAYVRVCVFVFGRQ